jgi:hypothetical protein
MKRIAVLLVAVMAISISALAQEGADKAVLAAPANMRDGATVIQWKADFTYDTVKKGTNNLVCYDLSGKPAHPPFMVECTSMANLDRVAQNLKFEAAGDKAKTQGLLDAAEKDGTRVKPQYGSVWYHFMGPDQEHARTHFTIAVPGATGQTLGLPNNGKQGGVWVMNEGTSTAHLMTPGE